MFAYLYTRRLGKWTVGVKLTQPGEGVIMETDEAPKGAKGPASQRQNVSLSVSTVATFFTFGPFGKC